MSGVVFAEAVMQAEGFDAFLLDDGGDLGSILVFHWQPHKMEARPVLLDCLLPAAQKLLKESECAPRNPLGLVFVHALLASARKPFGLGFNLRKMRGQPAGRVQRQIGEVQLGQQGEATRRRRFLSRQLPRIVEAEQAA